LSGVEESGRDGVFDIFFGHCCSKKRWGIKRYWSKNVQGSEKKKGTRQYEWTWIMIIAFSWVSMDSIDDGLRN
jgi:hypothetical protein